jgi:hypothetical protein
MSTDLVSACRPTQPAASRRQPILLGSLLVLTWAVLLAGVLAAPHWMGSPTLGDDRTRWTVRLALVYYGVALGLLLYLGPTSRLARWCWTLAWLTYLVHLGMAFEYYHHWSHADAVEHTQQVSGFGPGIYVSHFFTLVWTADVALWWLAPLRRARRSVWIDRLLHGFMLFVVFNATVVYEGGLIRWAGVAGFAALGLLCVARTLWPAHTALIRPSGHTTIR